MIFFLLINMKMLTIGGIFIFITREKFTLNYVFSKLQLLVTGDLAGQIICSAELSTKKSFITSGPESHKSCLSCGKMAGKSTSVSSFLLLKLSLSTPTVLDL